MHALCVIFLFLFDCFLSSAAPQTGSSDGESCRDPLAPHVNATADSSRLWDGSVWVGMGQESLAVDLGVTRNITGIATRGKDHVMEFGVQYGSNGRDWVDYREADGSPKLFRADVGKNEFEEPVIARWIRVSPTRWSSSGDGIIRLEIVGCEYYPEVLHFDGTALLRRDLTRNPVTSLRDTIRLRFKTDSENGVLLYSRGSQGDYLALQLVENKLLLKMNLGSHQETSMPLGSLLDDNMFHDVVIYRKKRDVVLSVDRVKMRDRIRGDFQNLNLDRYLFVGGIPHIDEGIVVYENFTGCIESFYLNHSNVIAGIKDGSDSETVDVYEEFGGVGKGGCITDHSAVPVTFKNADSFVRLTGGGGGDDAAAAANVVNVSLEFRTYEENGLLFYHRLRADGYVKLFLEDGRIKAEIVTPNSPKTELDNFDLTYSDGKWHSAELELSKNRALLTVDNEPTEKRRGAAVEVVPGADYLIGGGLHGHRGFVGCMRRISIEGGHRSPSEWTSAEYSSREEVALESCYVTDRCSPNPCEHGGICKQNSEEYYCDCDGTGYSGAVCHSSLNFKSCVHYKNAHPESSYAETTVDVDGSGPLAPFPVRCEFGKDGRNVTYIDHANEAATKVDGFEEKGSYQQLIHYDTSMDIMEALINRSKSCAQKLGYDCKKSRLLNTPVGEEDNFSPFGYWMSRQNRPMDYWAGSVPGSHKCECGLLGVCFDPLKWCNCDSGHDDWLWDGGEITQKEFLPVKALHFGDTGNPLDHKEGRYTLGPLECEGDTLFDNAVTFKKKDASIALPPIEFGQNGDIYFEFKTTSAKTMVLLHSVGTNGDFLKVSIINGNHIQFEFESGKGQQGVIVETVYRLDDDLWHSVLVERNSKEAMVVIDGARKGQIREPSGPVRPMLLDQSMFVGATKDMTDGFVGCMRALVVNGVAADLFGEVTQNPLYGVRAGCQGKCSGNPCQNGGKCREGYSHFTCDCQWTPFKGPICADEVGVSLRSNHMIKYDFKGKTTIAERIRVGFTATEAGGFLLGAFSDISKEYLTLLVSDTGTLHLVFDFGFERQEMVFKEHYLLTGEYHEVRVERSDEGRRLTMKVDDYEPVVRSFSPNSSAAAVDAHFNNVQYLYIGRNESMQEGFSGCISRVEYDDIIPLKLLFQEDPLSNIQAIPATIAEDFCGIEAVAWTPDKEEEDEVTRKPPKVNQESSNDEHYYHATNSVILGAVLACLFLIMVVFSLLTGKYVNRHKGAYITREDEGANEAFDADTAVGEPDIKWKRRKSGSSNVVHSTTTHSKGKKRYSQL